MIPNSSTRDWVLQVGYWQSNNVGFSVSEWSPTGTFQQQKLASVPIWVKFTNIPFDLYSLAGITVIASAVGEPMHTKKSRLNFTLLGEAKVKVELKVTYDVPDIVEVEDDEGN